MERTAATSVESTTSSISSTSSTSSTPDHQSTYSPMVSSRAVFHNMVVSQRAVYQPAFRFRRWLEGEKQVTQEGEQETIAEIEGRLSPLKGQSASVIHCVAELKKVERRLLEFYGGRDQQYKRLKWDMERARHFEHQLIADSLLGIVGGSIGRP
ncbi:hypothetical protein BGX30_002368 [Mortierella sp. GBA39]|nr:hypothetical protein BGX30_002368 [Mortierella sp. GBA39]